MLQEDLDRITRMLEKKGWTEIPHGDSNLLNHCIGVSHILRKMSCEQTVVIVGLLHSAYGAASYPTLEVQFDRQELVQLIGEKPESLVYAYSAVVPESLSNVALSKNPFFFRSRYSDFEGSDFEVHNSALLNLFFANLVEQYPMRGELRNYIPKYGKSFHEVYPIIIALAEMIGEVACQTLGFEK